MQPTSGSSLQVGLWWPSSLASPCQGRNFHPKLPAEDWKGLYLAPGRMGAHVPRARRLQQHDSDHRISQVRKDLQDHHAVEVPKDFLAFLWHDAGSVRWTLWCGRDEKPLQLHGMSQKDVCLGGSLVFFFVVGLDSSSKLIACP